MIAVDVDCPMAGRLSRCARALRRRSSAFRPGRFPARRASWSLVASISDFDFKKALRGTVSLDLHNILRPARSQRKYIFFFKTPTSYPYMYLSYLIGKGIFYYKYRKDKDLYIGGKSGGFHKALERKDLIFGASPAHSRPQGAIVSRLPWNPFLIV
jgi:hypothetical protein